MIGNNSGDNIVQNNSGEGIWRSGSLISVLTLCLEEEMFQTTFLKFYKILGSGCLCSQTCRPANLMYTQKREISFLLNWFINVFNGVSRERLKLVGPDCTCAEWLLRNGASVRFKGESTFLSDYNELIKLEETGTARLKVEEVYGRKVAVNSIGFNHFKDCNHVKKITFIFCLHITDSALMKLSYVKGSLEHLELRSCFNIMDKGVNALQDLSNLKTLILTDLVSVKNKEECEAALRRALPKCKITFEAAE